MPTYFTPEGFKKIKEKLEFIKKIRAKALVKKIQEVASQRKISDNAAFQDAKEKQELLQIEINKLEKQISNAEVIEKKESNKVQIGSEVLVLYNNEEITFHIVGPALVDPSSNKISYQSPLGNALLEKSVGDTVEVETESGRIMCKIIKIS